ncbi:conjugal transfer protein TrbM [Alcaligenaceae bacterium]|nr:conjugal transfer protein TrbM [Alcaligenaceae bacterium]
MKQLPTLVGALALSCASVPSHAQSSETLTGTVRLACEAILCLSSGVRPGQCSASLNRYFDIRKYRKGALDWSATVNARRAFLGMCPAETAAGMGPRLDAIARGAGKCDAEYLNTTYAATSYRYPYSLVEYYPKDVTPIKTVAQNKLPAYCVAYNDHAWTYDLTIKYVGDPLRGGHWVKASDYAAAQAKWEAEHGGMWAKRWRYSWQHPITGESGRQQGRFFSSN